VGPPGKRGSSGKELKVCSITAGVSALVWLGAMVAPHERLKRLAVAPNGTGTAEEFLLYDAQV
jgi:hypothetical protein